MNTGKFQKGNTKGKGRPKGSINKVKNIGLKTIYEDLVGSFKSGSSYVYYHVDIKTDEVVYIGKGINNRAWDFNSSSRNKQWSDYLLINKVKVRIVTANLSDLEALAIERALIETVKPILNKQHIIDNNN
tara:strand:+ start:410 stop:799 length:390 start_codon:yes stop_codon:yes gene_type:complete